MDPIEAVLECNREFYRAFAAGDIEAMEAVWSRAEDVTCIHPGWQALLDRPAVMESWRAILAAPPSIRCVAPRAFVSGSTAYVVCRERLGNGTLAATNILRWEDGAWRMIHHQAGPTHSAAPEVSKPAETALH